MSARKKQGRLFDAKTEEGLRDAGKARAAESRAEWLYRAQHEAFLLGRAAERHGAGSAFAKVNMDDVHEKLDRCYVGYDPSVLGNAAGSVFRSSIWEHTGRTVKSQRKGRHASRIAVWRLRVCV